MNNKALINSFVWPGLPLRLTAKILSFLRLTAKFLAVLRLTVNPIETLCFHFNLTADNACSSATKSLKR